MIAPVLLLIVTVYNIALAILIFRQVASSRAGRYLAGLILSVAIWTCCEGLIELPSTGRETVIFLSRLMILAGEGMLIYWLFFCAFFPTTSPRFARLAAVLSLPGFLWAVLAFTPAFIQGATVYPWGSHIVVGTPILYRLYGIWLLVGGGAGITHLVVKARCLRGIPRLQTYYVILGFSVLLSVGAVTDAIIPAATGNSTLSHLGPLASICLTTAATYAIIRYRLLDIRVIISLGVSYSITIAVLSIFFALLVALLNMVVDATKTLSLQTANFAAAMIIALIFQPLLKQVRRIIDQHFLRSNYDYQQTLATVGQMLTAARTRKEILNAPLAIVDRTLFPRAIAVYLATDEGVFTSAYQTTALNIPAAISHTNPVIQRLTTSDEIIVTQEYQRQSPDHQSIASELTSWSVALAIPLISTQHLLGVIFLGEKLADDTYTNDDLNMLQVIARQAATAMDNINYAVELRNLNAELEQRIEERTAELRRVNDQLREEEREKDKFFAVLSHELLTPLTSILGWAEVAQVRDETELYQRATDIIYSNAKRQKRLVDDLLAISRIIHNKLSLDMQVCDLNAVVRQSVEDMQHAAAVNGISINACCTESSLPIVIDQARITQVLHNLLVNAMKFSPKNGRIEMSCHQSQGKAIIDVRDYGRGIPRRQLEQIFRPFKQVDRMETNGGLGLGLAITKGIIELHGGEITASSQGENQGSTFTITLPLCSDASG